MDMEVRNEIGFQAGDQVVIRPVLEEDLEMLAYLKGESPVALDMQLLPWTTARLRKKFEDKDKPGLWDKGNCVYSVVRKTGGVIGFFEQEVEDNGCYWINMHIQESLPDRDELGQEALSVFMAMLSRWKNVPRIGTAVLAVEKAKLAWYEHVGFEEEISCRDGQLYRGEYCDLLVLGWLSDWVKANRAPEGIGVKES